jgi:hypothetical protein
MSQVVFQSAVRALERNATSEGYACVVSYMLDCISNKQDMNHTIQILQRRNPHQSLWEEVHECEGDRRICRSKRNVREWKQRIVWSRKDPFLTRLRDKDPANWRNASASRELDRADSRRTKRQCLNHPESFY